MQTRSFIMTAFGKDRPGIVADVTQVIYECGCNLEDSTMSQLADEFTLIMLFTGTGDDLEGKLSNGCRRLEIEKSLTAYIRPVPTITKEATPASRIKTIEVEGLDQAGIVFKVSRYLADHNINIIRLESQRSFTPESGQALYRMSIRVELPKGVDLEEMASGFESLGNELNVDITF